MRGIITKIISNDYTVVAGDYTCVCKARGKFRKDKIIPLVGDMCDFDEQRKYITEIYPRSTELIRPSVANIDQAIIVTSVKEPDFSTNLLDKLLCIIEFNNIKPIICFTKLDLLNDMEKSNIYKFIDYYKKIGYMVFINDEIDEIKLIFKDKKTVFTGQSGSGKSTLLNKLDDGLNLKTNEISIALGRGKHTTRHVELISLFGGLVADTPGFSSLDFIGMTKEDIRDNFIEFNQYKDGCEYRDCMHISETRCNIKRELGNNIMESRYENYLKFLKR